MGRPPINGKAMTGAERQRRLRQKRRAVDPARDPEGWRTTWFLPVQLLLYDLIRDMLDDPLYLPEFGAYACEIVRAFDRFDERDRELRRRWRATIKRHKGRLSRPGGG